MVTPSAVKVRRRQWRISSNTRRVPCRSSRAAKDRSSTHDQDVFSFYPDERPCNGFPEALTRYKEIVPQLRLAGPTSFSPIIEMAMTIVEQSSGQYHVLVIIADGQVMEDNQEINAFMLRRTVPAVHLTSENVRWKATKRSRNYHQNDKYVHFLSLKHNHYHGLLSGRDIRLEEESTP